MLFVQSALVEYAFFVTGKLTPVQDFAVKTFGYAVMLQIDAVFTLQNVEIRSVPLLGMGHRMRIRLFVLVINTVQV